MKAKTHNRLAHLMNCLNHRQSLLLIIMTFVISTQSFAGEKITRKPSSVDEEVIVLPVAFQNFSSDVIFAEDDAGIMREVKSSLESWDRTDEYAKKWDLKSTGLYNTPETIDRKAFIRSKILKYADKRLSGEMKKAEEGSTLHTMARVEKSLRPNANVNISKDFGLKFKVRVLQGTGIVEVKNPWIDCNATVNAKGETRVVTKKEFKNLGASSGAEYSVNDSVFLAYVDQQLTGNIKARVSSTQSNGTNVFADDADARMELTASFPFNF